jgi:PDZ domain-containing protein
MSKPATPVTRRMIVMTIVRMLLLTVVVCGLGYVIPTPFMLRAPGHADELSHVVRVQGGEPHPPGRLYMTTVIFEKANLLYCLYALLDPAAQLLPASVDNDPVTIRVIHNPNDMPLMHPLEMPRPESMMERSKHFAAVAALRWLGYPITVRSKGLRVGNFMPDNPNAKVLKAGDVIEWAGERRVRTVQQLHDVVSPAALGAKLPVKIERNQGLLDLDVTIVEHAGHHVIGVVVSEVPEEPKLPVDVDIVTHNVNGASGGLMFTLEIIDQLTPGGITHGRRIAGTGTMDPRGVVGPIEGVELKEVAAERVHAELFLVPKDNLSETKPPTDGMKIVPVRTLEDALKAIGAPPRPKPMPTPSPDADK